MTRKALPDDCLMIAEKEAEGRRKRRRENNGSIAINYVERIQILLIN